MALHAASPSVVGLIGPGGQGKTAIVQHWLQPWATRSDRPEGLFFWSFYRGKDADLCLRELLGYAEQQVMPTTSVHGGLPHLYPEQTAGSEIARSAEVSASYCVDHLLPVLRRERWAIVLDGAEVVQHESGAWLGRFVHPELGRLVEELASEPMPGVLILTTRFALPTLACRRHARLIDLNAMDEVSALGLLRSFGVRGSDAALGEAAAAMAYHAKGVELLGTWLAQFAGGDVERYRELPDIEVSGASLEERSVARVLAGFQACLPAETRDILALATAFRQPPTPERLLEYLASEPVQAMLRDSWQRDYQPLARRGSDWLESQIQWLVDLRLLERVGQARHRVIDTHPLVRRGFEEYLGPENRRHGSLARAGFLRGRPDRRPPQSLADSREEVELFHAYCDAGLWNEADSILVALDNPKHRFLAPAFERDLLLNFFPQGDWRRPPLWPGFGRWRSLAICLEMLGQFSEALEVYRPEDAALAGDALIALGRLQPLLEREHMPQPWQNLWRAYRAHALCLAGRTAEAIALARMLVPVDIYEWVHVFECLLRCGELREGDVRSMLNAVDAGDDPSWRGLVRRRMVADWKRISEPAADLEQEYRALTEAFDKAGMPWERGMARLGYTRWLLGRGRMPEAQAINNVTADLAGRFAMPVMAADACEVGGDAECAGKLRGQAGYLGPARQ
jgi:hypothetical protein